MELHSKITGAKDLDDILRQLPKQMASRVATNALRAGGRVIRDSARTKVPVETGELRKSLRVITGKGRNDQNRVVHVGVFGKESPLAHIIEFGSIAHRIAAKKKTVLSYMRGFLRVYATFVQHPGTKARPFLRPAADESASAVVAKIGEVIAESIEREGNRARARLAR